MTDLDLIRQQLELVMPPKTYKHVLRVEKTGVKLARLHHLDETTVRLGCLLHDAYKHWPLKKLQEAMGEDLTAMDEHEQGAANLLHGRVAARRCPWDYNVMNEEALFSMAFHTTGHPDFTPAQLAVFVADKSEPKRDYPGVDRIRMAAQKDLQMAGALIVRRTVKHLEEKGARVHPLALEAMKKWSEVTVGR